MKALAAVLVFAAACASDVAQQAADAGPATAAMTRAHADSLAWDCEQSEACRAGGGTPQREAVDMCLKVTRAELNAAPPVKWDRYELVVARCRDRYGCAFTRCALDAALPLDAGL